MGIYIRICAFFCGLLLLVSLYGRLFEQQGTINAPEVTISNYSELERIAE